eukprot:TRINITY_DN94688_c0_g1_i1.p1 TRINITY_DN94688_c0_g1~~TRINITY_DN94688_c0_g1_i1.p1  ORF type:complete len:227 (+),score=20.68 TRINITY_DN94688_c0_g1_i1:115-795(+)
MSVLQSLLMEHTLAQECEEVQLEWQRSGLAAVIESNRQRVNLLVRWHMERIESQLLEQAKLSQNHRCRGIRVPRREGGYRTIIKADQKQSKYRAVISFCRHTGHRSLKQGCLENEIGTMIEAHQELVRKWYLSEYNIKILSWHCHAYRWYICVDWSSEEVETKVRETLLQPGRQYDFNMKLALKLLRPELPPNCVDNILDFVPNYRRHLQHELKALEYQLSSQKPW